ncbi:MAG TPA: amidohydrolase family protein [Streptosporangiaceae bacterium]|nr:amidohydrolase family protein [Streptosporangiaceae bacterium]
MASDKTSGVSRRTVLKTGAVTGAAAAGSLAISGPAAAAAVAGPQSRRPGQSTSPAGDLILRNGRIHTMDSHGAVVSVLAIRDGYIVYAGGSMSGALRQFSSRPQVIDLGGRMAMPGIIDCHNHIVLMGNRPGHHTPLENAYSIADVQALYAERARTLPRSPNPPTADDFITTIGGFNPSQFKEGRLPTLAELDAAVPDRPVYLSIGFIGPSATNSLGKAFFENVPAPYGPVTVGADGSIGPSGFVTAGPTGQATLALRQTLTFDQRKRSVRDAMAYAASMGVTTHLDQGAFQATNTPTDGSAHEDNFTMHLPFLSVYAEGDRRDAEAASQGIIRLRTNFLLWDTDPTVPIATQRVLNAFPFFGGDLVRTGAAGEFLADPFRYYAGGNPVWMAAALKVAQAGWRAEVHSLTPTDFQTEIQSFEAVNAQVSIKDLRWVVAHVPHITEDYVNRLKAVGGGVNLTPYEYFGAASPAGAAGPPYRMLVDNGIPVGLSSDGMQIAPMNPWIHAYYATTGLNAQGTQINPGQQLTRAEVLTHYTSANRWFLGGQDEEVLGTLEVGRLGDVVVLSDDYFSVPDSKLRDLHSELTVLGGTVVHTGDIRYWA